MPTPRTAKKSVAKIPPVRVRRPADNERVIQDIHANVEALTATVNDIVTSMNGMAEDMAVVASCTRAMEETLTTLTKASLKFGPVADENNKLSKEIRDTTSRFSELITELSRVAESNARVLEELRKRVG